MAKRAKIDLKVTAPRTTPAAAPEPSVSKRRDRGPSRDGRKMIGGFFPPETAKQLAQLALDHDKTQQALLDEAIEDLFAKYKAIK
jgi:hypothetical protein